MSEEHVNRILKMLEEGKISAAEAGALIQAVGEEEKRAPVAPSPQPPPPPPPPPVDRAADGPEPKSFEFNWGSQGVFPVDLSGLGKQISDVVRKINPDRIMREARRGKARVEEQMRRWGPWFDLSDTGSEPENAGGLPAARDEVRASAPVIPGAVVEISNPLGDVVLTTGADVVEVIARREAWASTDAAAAAELALTDVRVTEGTADAPGRVTVTASAGDAFKNGRVDLEVRVPVSCGAVLNTTFGNQKVSGIGGALEASSVTGAVDAEGVAGSVRLASANGPVRLFRVDGEVSIETKCGDVIAAGLRRGAVIVSLSGDIAGSEIDGGRVEVRTASGDVSLESVGLSAPVDIRAESVSGDVRVRSVHGTLHVESVSGDASLTDANANAVLAHSVTGSVNVELNVPFAGSFVANTVSGDVSVRAPVGSNFRYSLTTRSGDLSCDGLEAGCQKTGSMCTGQVGTGAGSVSVQTFSGDVRLAIA